MTNYFYVSVLPDLRIFVRRNVSLDFAQSRDFLCSREKYLRQLYVRYSSPGRYRVIPLSLVTFSRLREKHLSYLYKRDLSPDCY